MSSNKREINYSVQELLGVGFTLIVLGIGIAYGLEIMADSRDDFGTDSCADTTLTGYNASSLKCYNTSNQAQAEVSPQTAQWNSTVDGITGVAKIPEKLPTIATVVVASVIIGILVTYLWARFARM